MIYEPEPSFPEPMDQDQRARVLDDANRCEQDGASFPVSPQPVLLVECTTSPGGSDQRETMAR